MRTLVESARTNTSADCDKKLVTHYASHEEETCGEPRTDTLYRYGGIIFAALLITIALYCRIRLLSVPLERDEGGFAYIGQQLLHGIPPYVSGNMKILAGIHFAYALIMTLFGQSAQGIHTGLLLVNAASTVMLFILARRVLSIEAAAVTVGIFAFLSVHQSVLGVFAHATHFVMLFVLAGLIALLTGLDKNRPCFIFTAGIFLGLSLLMKQHGIFFCLFAFCFLARESYISRYGMRGTAARLSLLALGMLIPYAATCLYMIVNGVFTEFWFWTVMRSLSYGTENSISQGLQRLAFEFGEAPKSLFLFVCLSSVGLYSTLHPRCNVRRRWFLPSLLLISVLATLPGFFFYTHYFVMVLPALSLLAGVAYQALPHMVLPIVPKETARPAVLALFLLIGVINVYQQRDYLFRLSPNDVSRMIYRLNSFPESLTIARYIKENSLPGTQIAVFGSEPQIYFYADRPSATDYLYMYSLVNEQPYVERMQDEMIREIEKACPDFIVFVWLPTSWMIQGEAGYRFIDWADNYLEAHYRQVGLADLISADITNYYWGNDAAERMAVSDYYIQVFRRTIPSP